MLGSQSQTQDTRAWVRATGYDVFGQPGTDEDHPALPRFGYRGELVLGDALYLRARMYDPAVGRFRSRDPQPPLFDEPAVASPYAYANNDPVNLIDPLGTTAVSDVLCGLGALLSDGSSAGKALGAAGAEAIANAIGAEIGAIAAGVLEALTPFRPNAPIGAASPPAVPTPPRSTATALAGTRKDRTAWAWSG